MHEAGYLPSKQGAGSQYRGVSFHKASGLWHARCHANGRCHSLGYHRSDREAAAAVQRFRVTCGLPVDALRPSTGDGTALIELRARDGHVRAYAVVDVEDAQLAGHRWSLGAEGYVTRRARAAGGGYLTYALHRVILGLRHGDAREGDHIDRDPLNNRRSNLRVLSHSHQMQNVPSLGATSPHRGVSFDKAHGKWKATARAGGKRHHLGFFTDEQEAARVTRDFRREHMPYATD
jgi:hypothetical protein